MKRSVLFFLSLFLVTILLSACGGGSRPFVPTFGGIQVSSDPQGAQIYLDDVNTGLVTPATLRPVLAGTRTIKLVHSDFQTETITVVVQKDQVTVIEPTLTKPSIYGVITQSVAGRLVEGATVVAYQEGTEVASTTTDDRGVFSFALGKGTYELLADKPGHAQSRFQGILVGDEETVKADMVLAVTGNQAVQPSAPTINVQGIEAFWTYAELAFSVSVDSAYPWKRGEIRWYPVTFSPFFLLNQPEQEVTFKPSIAGPSVIQIIATDVWNNRAVLQIPVTYAVQAETRVPHPTKLTQVKAVTTAVSLDLLQTPIVGLQDQNTLIQVPNGRTLDLQAIDTDSTLFVRLDWAASPTEETVPAVQYRIYRADTVAGPYQWVAQTPSLGYLDMDSRLTPNKEFFYRVVGVSADGTYGLPSRPERVIPLPLYEVRLETPNHRTNGVSVTPTFTWSHNGVGDHQVARLYVKGAHDGYYVILAEGLLDVIAWAEWEDGASLEKGKLYEWDINWGYAYRDYSQVSWAVSLSNGYGGESGTGSSNGSFLFTTEN